MKVKIPAKTVEVCDICERQGSILETCLICKKQYCLLCDAYLPGCMIEPRVCKRCDDRIDVVKLVGRYAKDFLRICKLRDKALDRLGLTEEQKQK